MATGSTLPNSKIKLIKTSDVVDVADINAISQAVEQNITSHLADYANRVFWGTEYLATLQNGWTGSLLYYKNGMGLVVLVADLIAGTLSQDTTIAVLPAGYRPSRRMPVIVYNKTRGAIYGGLVIDTSGNIATRTPFATETQQGQGIQFNVIYRVEV